MMHAVSSFVFLWKVNEASSYKDLYKPKLIQNVKDLTSYLHAVHKEHPWPKAVLMDER